jgi:hypothetical protein
MCAFFLLKFLQFNTMNCMVLEKLANNVFYKTEELIYVLDTVFSRGVCCNSSKYPLPNFRFGTNLAVIWKGLSLLCTLIVSHPNCSNTIFQQIYGYFDESLTEDMAQFTFHVSLFHKQPGNYVAYCRIVGICLLIYENVCDIFRYLAEVEVETKFGQKNRCQFFQI